MALGLGFGFGVWGWFHCMCIMLNLCWFMLNSCWIYVWIFVVSNLFWFPYRISQKSPPQKSQIPETYVQKLGPIKKPPNSRKQNLKNSESQRKVTNVIGFHTKMLLGGACLLACHFPPPAPKNSMKTWPAAMFSWNFLGQEGENDKPIGKHPLKPSWCKKGFRV